MIRFEHVTRRFQTNGNETLAVNDVSFEIKDGEIFGIIGFSGAGKSTLVRCINLLERPDSGRVYVNGKDITALKTAELRKERKKIGMIFQQFHLFTSRTVSDNIAFPLKGSGLTKDQVKNRVKELLSLVELEEKADAYPADLSGGQKQRVAIARALACEPDILLSDESTSALDPKTTKSILQLLKKVNRELGITIVIITHEMQVIKDICDRVAVMKGGEVLEMGEVFDLFTNPKTATGSEFVESTSNLSKIYDLIEEKQEITKLKPGEAIYKFTYKERNVSEALISYLSRTYNLGINIIFGNIELIGENPIGGLVSVISGRPEDMEAAVAYLEGKNVGVEVVLDGRTA